MKEKIRRQVLARGAVLCGFAPAEDFCEAPEGFRPTDLYPGCRSVVVFATPMPKGLVEVPPRILYAHATNLSVGTTDRLALEAALLIEEMGGRAVPLPSDDPVDCIDQARNRRQGLLSLRHAAVLAGLGTLGKNNLVINRDHGSMITVGAVLTDLNLSADPPAQPVCVPGCGRCRKACPTGALTGPSTDQARCRPHTYSQNDGGFGVVNCNRCRTVCPVVLGVR